MKISDCNKKVIDVLNEWYGLNNFNRAFPIGNKYHISIDGFKKIK